jgi:hypothetical protein
MSNLKQSLFKKFNNQCAYCGVNLSQPAVADIDHFYPKSKYPEFSQDISNLLIVCKRCNTTKRDSFPLDGGGNPLLVNPTTEKMSDHISIDDNGYLTGTTEKGKATISTLNLNNEALVNQRILKSINMDFYDGSKRSGAEITNELKSNLQKISDLNTLALLDTPILKSHMAHMLYANSITLLETYLCDRFIALVRSHKKYMRAFVKNFHNFKQEKFELCDIFDQHEQIEEKSIAAMREILYHNLPKVSGIYQDTFNIKFPNFTEIYKAVIIRHDIVHRSGKTKNGKTHQLDEESVRTVMNDIDAFVHNLEEKLKEL